MTQAEYDKRLEELEAEADRRGVLPIFFLELCSGLRKGELVALLWQKWRGSISR